MPSGGRPRAAVAAREGLHGAFGFPIKLGGIVLGVLEFFSREIREPDQELLELLATIGSQIGQFVERKRAENELEALFPEVRQPDEIDHRVARGDLAAEQAYAARADDREADPLRGFSHGSSTAALRSADKSAAR